MLMTKHVDEKNFQLLQIFYQKFLMTIKLMLIWSYHNFWFLIFFNFSLFVIFFLVNLVQLLTLATFLESWEKENLPSPNSARQQSEGFHKKKLVDSKIAQTYKDGEWKWMIDHILFTPFILLENSLSIAFRNPSILNCDPEEETERNL